jgi:hypothetical protein
MVHGESLPKMKKESLVTLLESGTIKIETIYRIEPSLDTFITSEAIKSPEKLRNVTIGINGKEISKENYEEYFLHDGTYRYIALKRSLTVYANINKPNEVYVKYETKLPTGYQFKVDLIELCQRTEPQVNVNYSLIVQSFDNNYVPRVIGNQDEFLVNHDIEEGFTTLSRTYKSFDISEEKIPGIQIKGLFFINVASKPLQESTRTFKVVDSNLVKEIYNYKLRGVKGEHPEHLSVYPISEYVELSRHPKINIKIDGNEFVPILIEYDELKRIVETGNYTKPFQYFYYFGKGLNSNENTLYIGYILNEGSIGEINIETEYDANKVLTSKDGFNYVFENDLTVSAHTSKIKEFLNFEIPEEFNIEATNYKSNLITTSFKGSNNLRFKFENISDYKPEPLKIEFSRRETKFFNFIKIVNICLLFGIINLSLLWLFGIIPFKISYVGYILSIVAIVYGLSIGKFSGSNFFEAVNYTYSWIPIILGMLGFMAQMIYKIIK